MSPRVDANLARCARALGFLLLAVPATTLSAAPPQFLFGPATPVAELNAPGFGETALSLTPDGLEAFFRRGTAPPGEFFATSSEIYTARRTSTSEPFGTPVLLAELSPPAEYGNNGPNISADGLTLYFGRGLLQGTDNERQKAARIFAATRPTRDAPFGAPQEITSLRDAGNQDGMGRPELSADGLSMYMQYLPVGPWASDVYVAQRASFDSDWGEAQPLQGFSEPFPNWESAPAVSADDRTLFVELTTSDDSIWPSNLRGVADVYLATRPAADQPWSSPVSLGDAINSANAYQTDPFLTADGSTLYFNRANGNIDAVSWDLYQAPVLPFNAISLAGHGGAYQQNFDSLGDTSKTAGQAFPAGWTFTANDVVFNNATTQKFPAGAVTYAGAFNAGAVGEGDRALATGETDHESGELQFRAHVEGGAVQALRLSVDVEAWQVAKIPASEPGEAAFNVILEADTGKGFAKLADLGRATTGEKLVFPDVGSGLNGNDSANRGSFDSGPVSLSIPEGATLRLRFVPPGETDVVGWTFGLDNLSLHTAAPGDANVDGKVDLADFGTLKANFVKDGRFTDGDFSGNGTVDLSDFGLLKENFGKSAAAGVPEPSSLTLAACGAIALLALGRRSTALGRKPVQRRGNRVVRQLSE